jgi:hypothetical protein
MKKTLLLAALLSFLPALQAVRPPVAKLRFAPAAGTKLTRTFENKAEFSLDDMTLKMSGQDTPTPKMEMTMTQDQKLVVSDEFVKVREGAPQVLRRKFDELGSEMTVDAKIEMMGQAQPPQHNTGKGVSGLTGKTVVFTWDDESKAFKTAFDPAEEKSELLKGLREDMDLRVLLPKDEVKAGDEWDVEVSELAGVIAPGGELKIKPEEKAGAESPMGMGDMSGMSGISDWLGESMTGKAKAKFTGMREVGGHSYAVISLDVKVKGSKDLTESAKAMDKHTQEGMTMELKSIDVEFEIAGQGELLWDVEAGYAHSFEFSGPSSARVDTGMSIEVQNRKMEVEYGMELSGTMSLKLTIE